MAVIDVNDVYVLGETGAQVDKVTGLFTKDESTTSGEKAFAQLNIGTAGSNRNLLINPWFRINQRGATSGTTIAYVADRWRTSFGGGGVTWSRTDDTVTVQSTNGTSHGDIEQTMEASLFNALSGKTVTLSVMLNDYSIISNTFDFPTSGNRGGTIGQGLDGNAVGFVIFYATRKVSITKTQTAETYRAVKLELGSVSTLANDAPPDYGTELAKCMRYFIRIKGDPIGSGYVTAGLNQAYIHIPTPVPMRTAPTASIDGSVYIRGTGTTWNVSTVTVTGASLQPTNGVSVVATVSATQVMAVSAYMSSASSYIDLSADL